MPVRGLGFSAGGASGIGAGRPQHVLLAAFVEVAGEDEQMVGQAVDVLDAGLVDRFFFGQFGNQPFGPAYHRARQVQMGGGGGATGQDEGGKLSKLGVEAVDLAFQPLHVSGGDTQRAFTLGLHQRMFPNLSRVEDSFPQKGCVSLKCFWYEKHKLTHSGHILGVGGPVTSEYPLSGT